MKNENGFEKLENALVGAGKTIAYPMMPPIAARVCAQLSSEQHRFSIWRVLQPRALTAVITLVIALAIFALPETRMAFAQFFGLDSAHVTSTWTPTTTIASTPSPLASTTVAGTAIHSGSIGTPATQPSNTGIIRQIHTQTSPSPTRP